MDRVSISRNSTSRLESFVEETPDSMGDGSISLDDNNEDDLNRDPQSSESKKTDQQNVNGDDHCKSKVRPVPAARRDNENLHVTFSSSSRIDEGSDLPPTENSIDVSTKV
jgi:hypothetical protein